ncbi:prk-2 [Pristionchus pacificus]|uniref:non-specific serine/threonine protein kinase n=1 Tax=Pristionchus pacificus TaxID=54126 RepID=A0A2A6BJH8_PRIPA|nr:prk-2 [Pristionchus pacificus]|eukprot:PDM65976.1 prk-2 [Pristionchus pacificus]
MGLPVLAKKVKKMASSRFLNLKALINGENSSRGFAKFRKNYKLKGEIGRGGFGIVYRAVRLSDEMPVAVKFIDRRGIKEWGKISDEQVPMEIVMLARCSKIEGTIPEGYLIVMERPFPSMDMFDLIKAHSRLDEDISAFLMKQIVETIQSCAERRVLHRDLKDENIVIDLVTGETKLIDFGAATVLKKSHYTDFQGTRLYCPPEWFLHSLYLGKEAAVWSLGVLLYNSLNGRLPFRNEKDICTAHLLGPLPFYSPVSPDARDLISRCLHFDPFARCSIEEMLAHPWLRRERPSWVELVSRLDSLSTPSSTSDNKENVDQNGDHSEELEEIHEEEWRDAQVKERVQPETDESGVGSSHDNHTETTRPIRESRTAKTSLLVPPSSQEMKEVVSGVKTKSSLQSASSSQPMAIALRPRRIRNAPIDDRSPPVLTALRSALTRERASKMATKV